MHSEEVDHDSCYFRLQWDNIYRYDNTGNSLPSLEMLNLVDVQLHGNDKAIQLLVLY